jgi:hypothetical protein
MITLHIRTCVMKILDSTTTLGTGYPTHFRGCPYFLHENIVTLPQLGRYVVHCNSLTLIAHPTFRRRVFRYWRRVM